MIYNYPSPTTPICIECQKAFPYIPIPLYSKNASCCCEFANRTKAVSSSLKAEKETSQKLREVIVKLTDQIETLTEQNQIYKETVHSLNKIVKAYNMLANEEGLYNLTKLSQFYESFNSNGILKIEGHQIQQKMEKSLQETISHQIKFIIAESIMEVNENVEKSMEIYKYQLNDIQKTKKEVMRTMKAIDKIFRPQIEEIDQIFNGKIKEKNNELLFLQEQLEEGKQLLRIFYVEEEGQGQDESEKDVIAVEYENKVSCSVTSSFQ